MFNIFKKLVAQDRAETELRVKAAHVRLGLLEPSHELPPSDLEYWCKHFRIIGYDFNQLTRDVAGAHNLMSGNVSLLGIWRNAA
jgi:hypothetical protein